jgi:hypothetical protein
MIVSVAPAGLERMFFGVGVAEVAAAAGPRFISLSINSA